MLTWLNQFHTLWALLGILLGFGFLIFVHELGHFLVAKWVGIKVTQFAIGFGPSVVSWRRGLGFRKGSTEPEYEKRLADPEDQAPPMGETEYRLNWMPLGGYVKMLGQEDLNPEAGLEEDERSFNRKPIWARACVISAGVVMNLIFGVIFFIIAFMAGVEFPPAIVGAVRPSSPAATTYANGHEQANTYQGLQPGDRITHIDGQPVTDFADVAVNTALATRGQTLTLTIERQGESKPLIYGVSPKEDPDTKLLALGVSPPISLTLGQPANPSQFPKALAEAGVEPGMRVVAANGQPIPHYQAFQDAVAAGQGKPVQVTFEDPKTHKQAQAQLSAIPNLTVAEDAPPHIFGLVPAIQVPLVSKGSPASRAGILPGDIIARIGPIAWPSWSQLEMVVHGSPSQPLALEVIRDGQLKKLKPVTPNLNGKIGIYFGLALDEPRVTQVLATSPLATLRLNAGSKILSVNGQPVNSYADLQRLLAAAAQPTVTPQKPTPASEPGTDPGAKTAETPQPTVAVTIGYQANIANTPPTQATIELNAQTVAQLAQAQWAQPLGPGPFKMLLIPLKAANPVAAMMLGIKKTHQVMLQTYVTLLRLFQGTVKTSHLRGPLGIADDGTSFAKKGWPYLMFFLGLISVNLVVINFLPIPIVDGGLMVFLAIEKLKGSPVSIRVQNAATVVGLALIGSVFLLTLFHDAKRLLLGM